MKHTYTISGMTCSGCKAKVEQAIASIPSISNIKVNLEKGSAEISMDSHVPTSKLQEALSKKGDYTIEMAIDPATMVGLDTVSESKTKLQQLFPLFLIFTFITGAAVLINIQKGWVWAPFMLDFMGLFFIVFSFFKLLDLKGFPATFKMYDPLAKVIPAYGWIYPFIELVLGLMFLMRWNTTIAIWITLVLLGITTIGVTRTLLDKKQIQCACLGTALKLPMTEATFIENTIMIAMAVVMLVGI